MCQNIESNREKCYSLPVGRARSKVGKISEKLKGALIVASLVSVGFVGAVYAGIAPGETAQDEPWAELARGWIASCAGKPCPLSHTVQVAVPDLWDDISQDGQAGDVAELWGKSVNFDDEVHGIIVDPSILGALADAFGAPVFAHLGATVGGHPVVHAGLTHTYGYLFSILSTPYGFKRSRWVSGEIERGLGLSVGTLGPAPSEGTLLGNVTYFAGRIAFRHSPALLARLVPLEHRVSTELTGFDYDGLALTRLEERVEVDGRPVKLWTDYVRFQTSLDGDAYWLVYTICDPEPRLITAFPVSEKSEQGDLAKVGTQKITTRYNGFVPGLTETTATGTRVLIP